MKKLVTHNQGFHADDVAAYAILKEVLSRQGESWTLERTRDPEIIAAGDIVFDVGEQYDPQTNRYDHHQAGRAGARENGILYASVGLVWKHFGMQLCSSENVWSQVDKGLISEIDAVDNGQNYVGTLAFENTGYSSLGNHIVNFKPLAPDTRTPETLITAFEAASEFVRGILLRMIHSCEALEQEYQEVVTVYNQAVDKTILVFQKDYERPTWVRLSEFPEPYFVIYPEKLGRSWRIEAIRKSMENMESRKAAPESWRGAKDTDLQTITGVSDAVFCHPSGFLFAAQSQEGALELAKKALLM